MNSTDRSDPQILSFDLHYNDFVHIPSSVATQVSTFLVDTQADISIFKHSSICNDIHIDKSDKINIRGITHNTISSIGTAQIDLYFGKNTICHNFHIVPNDFNIHTDGIIGKDFLERYDCNINNLQGEMTFTISPDRALVLKISSGPHSDSVVVPPRSEVIRQFQLDS